MIQVEPTLSGSWYWNDYDYYAEQVLTAVQEEIAIAGGRVILSSIEEKIFMPNPIKTSLRVFLR